MIASDVFHVLEVLCVVSEMVKCVLRMQDAILLEADCYCIDGLGELAR